MLSYEVCELMDNGGFIFMGLFSSLKEAEIKKEELEKEGKKTSIFVHDDNREIIDIIGDLPF